MSPAAVSPVFYQGNITSLAQLLALCIEFIIYGIYAALFAGSIEVLRRRTVHSQSGWVFFYSSIVLFLIATLHNFLNFPRLIKAFVLDPGGPLAYLNDTNQWENFANFLLLSAMINLGDALMAYRCYIIWGRNPFIIILPIIMLCASTGVSISIIVVFKRPSQFPVTTGFRLLDALYPILFAENTITTGLVALRLYLNYRQSGESKALRGHQSSFLEALKIVIESAFVYTLELFFLIILNARRNVFVLVLSNALIPTIGIVFNLIAVRIYLSPAPRAKRDDHVRPSQTWSRPVAFRTVALTSTPLADISEEYELTGTSTHGSEHPSRQYGVTETKGTEPMEGYP